MTAHLLAILGHRSDSICGTSPSEHPPVVLLTQTSYHTVPSEIRRLRNLFRFDAYGMDFALLCKLNSLIWLSSELVMSSLPFALTKPVPVADTNTLTAAYQLEKHPLMRVSFALFCFSVFTFIAGVGTGLVMAVVQTVP